MSSSTLEEETTRQKSPKTTDNSDRPTPATTSSKSKSNDKSEMSATPAKNGTASEYHRADTSSSLLGKLRYGDLSSPVASYYKPLLRTFTKRFDSPKVSMKFIGNQYVTFVTHLSFTLISHTMVVVVVEMSIKIRHL